jgi:hypothetical protein
VELPITDRVAAGWVALSSPAVARLLDSTEQREGYAMPLRASPSPIEISDRVMITDLISRYAYLLDYGQGREAEFAELFTEDGVFEIPSLNVLHRGRKSLEQLAVEVQKAGRAVHHVTSNIVIDFVNGIGMGWVYVNGIVLTPAKIHNFSHALYEDAYEKRDRIWYFKRRITHLSAASYAVMTSDELVAAGVATPLRNNAI